MKTLNNIEKSGFHIGQYVGYSKCGVWRVSRDGKNWRAILQKGQVVTPLPFAPHLVCKTLSELSAKLEAI